MSGRFSIEAIFRAVDRFTAPVLKMESRLSAFAARGSRALRNVESAAAVLASKLDTIGSAASRAALAIGIPAAAAGAIIGKVGFEFEQAITNVGAVSLMARDQISDLEKMALELGSTTKFSATEVASGMEILGRAGFNNQENLAAMPGVLAATAASGTEMAETTSHISNVLKGMGLEASQAGRVADVLALAEARTNSSIASLGESMANTAATARDLGIPLEQVVAGVALLQDVGLDASVAGSAVNTMLVNLAAPTDQVKAKLSQFGIAFRDAYGNAVPFGQILSQLAKGGDKAGGNMDRVAFFAELVGLRGQKAASNLAELFKKGKVEALVKELENAAGSAKKMADLRMQTLQGDLTKLKSAAQGVEIELYQTESGPLRGIVQQTTAWAQANKGVIASRFAEYARKVHDNLPEIWIWTKRIAIGVGIFLAVALAVKVVQTAIAAAQIVMMAFSGVLWIVRNSTLLFNGAVRLVRTAMLAYDLAMAGAGGANLAFLATLLPILVAIGAIIAAVWQFKKLLDEVGGFAGFGAGISKAWHGSIPDMGKNFFAGVDEYQNQQAKQAAKNRPDVSPGVSPVAGAPGMEWFQGMGGVGAPGGFDISKLGFDMSKLGLGADGLTTSADKLSGTVDGLTAAVNALPLGSDMAPRPGATAPGGRPEIQTVPPRVTRVVEEKKTTNKEQVEVLLTTSPGVDAKVTKPPKGNGTSVRVGASGSF